MQGANGGHRQPHDKLDQMKSWSQWANIRIVRVKEGAEGSKPVDFVPSLLLDVLGKDNF